MATSEMEAFIVRELKEKQKYIVELESRIAKLLNKLAAANERIFELESHPIPTTDFDSNPLLPKDGE